MVSLLKNCQGGCGLIAGWGGMYDSEGLNGRTCSTKERGFI